MLKKYIFRLDDIHPDMDWKKFEKIEKLFFQYQVKPIIGIVPQCEFSEIITKNQPGNDFWNKVKFWQLSGWTVSVHGYTHALNSEDPGISKIFPRSEFAGMPYQSQLKWLLLAREIMQKNGIITDIFMPPWHSFDTNTLKALKAAGFTKITDGHGFIPFSFEGLEFVPQQFQNPRKMPFGVWTFCLHSDTLTDEEYERIEQFIKQENENITTFPNALKLQHGICIKVLNLVASFGLRVYRQRRLKKLRKTYIHE